MKDIVLYLRKHVQTFGQVTLTLNDLLQEFGYSTNTNNKSIYSDFREIIKTEIINKGYGKCDRDIFVVKPNDLFHIQLSYENNMFFTEDNFVQITISEYENICSISSKINKSILLGIYIFIKQYIMDYQGDITPAKISFPSKSQIAKGLDTSIPTVESGLSILESNKLIYIRRDMFVENKKEESVFVPTRNVYALNPNELEGTVLAETLNKNTTLTCNVKNANDVVNIDGTNYRAVWTRRTASGGTQDSGYNVISTSVSVAYTDISTDYIYTCTVQKIENNQWHDVISAEITIIKNIYEVLKTEYYNKEESPKAILTILGKTEISTVNGKKNSIISTIQTTHETVDTFEKVIEKNNTTINDFVNKSASVYQDYDEFKTTVKKTYATNDMDLATAEAYVNSEYAVALTELEVM